DPHGVPPDGFRMISIAIWVTILRTRNMVAIAMAATQMRLTGPRGIRSHAYPITSSAATREMIRATGLARRRSSAWQSGHKSPHLMPATRRSQRAQGAGGAGGSSEMRDNRIAEI